MESPDAELIRAELLKLLDSAVFANSARLAAFLTFVVEHVVAGDSDQLKETTIGVEIYSRKVGYDPRSQPIVRTEARRLRSKLDEYYEGAGATDRVRILLPKGGYAPLFEVRPEPETPAAFVPPPTEPVQKRPSKPNWALAAAALLAIAGVILWSYNRRHLQPAAPPSIRPLTSYTGTELQPSFSPDGKQFAFVWDGGTGNFDIYAKLVNAGQPIRLTTDPGMDLFPSWSPNGDYLAFLRITPMAGSLYVVPALGGAERKVASLSIPEIGGLYDPTLTSNKPGPAWSPDGKYLVVSDNPGHVGAAALYEFAVDGSGSKRLTAPGSSAAGDFSPAFSPDGRSLAFIRREGARGNTTIYVLQHDGRGPRGIDFEERRISDLAWISDRQLIFACNRSGPNMLWQLSIGEGGPTPLLGAGRGMEFITYSPVTGNVAFEEARRNENIWRIGLKQGKAEGAAEKFLFSSRKTDGPDISSDGRAIVFVSDRLGTRQIWVAKASDGSSVQLSSVAPEVPIGTPRWSPDGRKIVYDTVQNRHSAVAVMNADGSQPYLVTADPWDDMMPSWSHDGQTIYFACRIDGRLEVCSKPASGGQAKQITKNGGGEVREAPDRRNVFYSKPNGIWQVSREGGGPETPLPGLADVEHQRYWTVTSDAIYLLTSTRRPWTVYRYDLATHVLSPLFNIEREPNFGSPGLAVAPDLSYLLFGQTDQQGTDIVTVDGLFSSGR